MDASERRTLWKVLDDSLWGKPLGLVVLPLAEFSVLALFTVPIVSFIRNALVGLDYLPDGGWYPTMVVVMLTGMLVLSFVHTGASIARPGRNLLRRIMAVPPTPGTHALASSVLRDVQLAAGLREYPLLRVYFSSFPNGCAYADWDGALTVAVSNGLAEGLGRDELRAVMAHLVARGQAPASRWLALAATAVEPFRAVPIIRDEPNRTADVWALVVGAAVFVGCLMLGWTGVSLLLLLMGMVGPALVLVGLSPKLVTWASTAVRPGLDEWGDARGLFYTKDARGMVRAAHAVLGSECQVRALGYDVLFYAPILPGATRQPSQRRRIAELELLVGAEGVGPVPPPIMTMPGPLGGLATQAP